MTGFNATSDRAATQEARHWIARLASGDITEPEMAAYRHWVADAHHHAVFQHELKLWRSLSVIGEHLAPREPVGQRAARRRRQGLFAVSGLAAAACLAAFLIGPDVWMRLHADHRTGSDIRAFTLADGTLAVLDADAAIAVHYGAHTRTVELLRGRVWFDVRHDPEHPFRVEAAGSVTEDIGTAFEVDYRATGGVETTVESGVVRVSGRAGGQSVILTAGQRALWQHTGQITRQADVAADRVASWRDGQLVLTAVPVKMVVSAIARYRSGLTLVVDHLDDLPPVTAMVDLRKPDDALNALAAGAHLRLYHLPGNTVLVRRSGGKKNVGRG
ncbi:FecR family protein [Acetobacter senegalensis]|uniref:FecR family protein n=1 Tax=Acetobacter senegalensis TaxID=446692 RepID=UPI001EDD310A|nr:FecR domain-containing protein [Acetobacter senegalensis]MCG4274719.1 FecR domain-containing protein [Acetobacter senegalensis]